MLAAYIWHWWIGLALVLLAILTVVALVLLAVLAIVALVGAYLKSVTAQQHPGRGQRSAHHTDL